MLEIAAGLFAMFLALGFCVLSPQRAGSLEADVCDVGDGLAAVVLAAVLPAIALVVSVTMLWRRELSKSAKVAAVLAPAVLALLVPAVVNLLPG